MCGLLDPHHPKTSYQKVQICSTELRNTIYFSIFSSPQQIYYAIAQVFRLIYKTIKQICNSVEERRTKYEVKSSYDRSIANAKSIEHIG